MQYIIISYWAAVLSGRLSLALTGPGKSSETILTGTNRQAVLVNAPYMY